MSTPKMVALPTKRLKIGQRLPFTVLDEHGRILLAKGLQIENREQLERLCRRSAIYVPFEESEKAIKVLMMGLVAADRNAAPIKDWDKFVEFEQPQPLSTIHTPLTGSFEEQCEQLTSRTGSTLSFLANHSDDTGLSKLRHLIEDVQQLLLRPEASLWWLTHQVITHPAKYGALHTLQCTVMIHQLSPVLKLERSSALAAALTMNMTMLSLQNVLALQKGPPTYEQRQAIDEHAEKAAQKLAELGMDDPLCLTAVRHHHEDIVFDDFDKLDEGLRIAHALRVIDRYTASMSPRANREGRTAREAAGYLLAQMRNDPVALALLNLWGLYPPGSFVELNTGDLGVVLKPGVKAAAPVVAVVANVNREPCSPRIVVTGGTETVVNALTGTAARFNVNVSAVLKLLK